MGMDRLAATSEATAQSSNSLVDMALPKRRSSVERTTDIVVRKDEDEDIGAKKACGCLCIAAKPRARPPQKPAGGNKATAKFTSAVTETSSEYNVTEGELNGFIARLLRIWR